MFRSLRRAEPSQFILLFFISRDVWTFSRTANFTYCNYSHLCLTFTLHFNSPCPDKIVFDTQPCWHRSSLLCTPSSVRQWIICKVIHCYLIEGWGHANSTSLQTPHMLNSVTKLGFGSAGFAPFLCHERTHKPPLTYSGVRSPSRPLAVRGLPHKPQQGRLCSCIS